MLYGDGRECCNVEGRHGIRITFIAVIAMLIGFDLHDDATRVADSAL